jgi:hypothetical protein
MNGGRKLAETETDANGRRRRTVWAWADGTRETTREDGFPYPPYFELSPPTEERAVNGEPEAGRRGR